MGTVKPGLRIPNGTAPDGSPKFYELTCEEYVSTGRVSSRICGKPASEVMDGGGTRRPLCPLHVGAYKRRSYMWGKLELATVADAEAQLAKKNARAVAKAAEDAVKAVENAAAAERRKVRRAEENTVEHRLVREDKVETAFGLRLSDPDREVVIPRWRVIPATATHDYDDAGEVKIGDDYGSPIVVQRSSSHLTPKAARALGEALIAAADVAEAK